MAGLLYTSLINRILALLNVVLFTWVPWVLMGWPKLRRGLFTWTRHAFSVISDPRQDSRGRMHPSFPIQLSQHQFSGRITRLA